MVLVSAYDRRGKVSDPSFHLAKFAQVLTQHLPWQAVPGRRKDFVVFSFATLRLGVKNLG